ncbi:hypothetical protein [Hufsiella ginkgonis]|uniref:Uncharacterized protein n=1 Tax=Hufsiella ginkgonis TaxID=2695274 RepID=A0A7K1XXN1_9SPHI|nr:hypothetical protein [Hufsiella ginkgonis]MXV15764.1 hypothetical protein [Hufsiella ginkgonis]
MLKASSLYIVLIISLIIAILSASLISIAFFYRSASQKSKRMNRLRMNAESGRALLLSRDAKVTDFQRLDLFDEGTDSVVLQKSAWGLFDVCSVKAFAQADTVKEAFLTGTITAADQVALFLSDEDRPLSVSGSTRITGSAQVPKSGVRQSYADGRPYTGTELIYGKISDSKRTLPALNEERLGVIRSKLSPADKEVVTGNLPDSVFRSFFNPGLEVHLDKSQTRISSKVISGRVSIYSDTVLTIPGNTLLKDVVIYARSIVIEEGFKGNCQLFARDSIVSARGCVFNYPSVMAIVKAGDSNIQPKISLGEDTRFAGILLSREDNRTALQTIISIGKQSHIKGEIYATGYLKMQAPVTIHGKVSCIRFIMQTPATLYENFLIDITIDRTARSKYYLSSSIFSNEAEEREILQWVR